MTPAEARERGVAAARRMRAALDPNTEPTNWRPLTSENLRRLGELRGVREFQFNAPLASEGELVTRGFGSFLIRVARPESSTRARFTLAHEIGHTFFDHGTEASAKQRVRTDRADEEIFCDAFASELLFPAAATISELRILSTTAASLLVCALERISRVWSVSVQTVLYRLSELGLPNSIIAATLKHRPHVKVGGTPALRVAAVVPRPVSGWFLPLNQRAISIGLKGALALQECWITFPQRNNGRTYRRTGTLSISNVNGEPVISENDRDMPASYIETIRLWQRLDARWRRRTLMAPVFYRLYASNVMEFYVLAVIDLSALPRQDQGAKLAEMPFIQKTRDPAGDQR